MAKLFVGLILYMAVLFLISAFVPTDNINAPIIKTTENINNSVEVSPSFWDFTDNFKILFGFFTFGAYNPLDMPSSVAIIMSLINYIVLLCFILACVSMARGGGAI